jgi:CDK-activating kinase assembly factor MAT1
VERECDIRKRVGAVYNKRQDEFETLLDWNNYLEDVEGLIFDLVEGGKDDKMRAEEKLRAYRESNLGEIEANKRAGLEEMEMEKRRERAEKEAARQRRLAAIKEAEEEKMDVEKSRRDVLEKLASGEGDAREITEMAQKVVLKKSGARRIASEALQNNGARDPNLTIRGLKKKEAPLAEKAYDPFGGVDLTPSRYVLQDDYGSEWLTNAKKDQRHAAGGYSLHEYYARTMFEAFSGLGVFIEDEVDRKSPHIALSNIATNAAAETSKGKVKIEHKMELDDVF